MDWLLTSLEGLLDALVARSDQLEALARLVVLVGVPTGLLQFYLKVRKEQRDREYGTYNALDEKYLEFQQLCFENPDLDIFDVPDEAPASKTPLEKKRELIAFTMLFSVFERAFLMYRTQSKDVRREQWKGWADYIASFIERDNFKAAWAVSGETFDNRFQGYMTAAFENRAPDLCAKVWWERMLAWRPWRITPRSTGQKPRERGSAG